MPSPFEQYVDLRSLATFRILFGIYILYDIYSRLQHGRLSLAFYTSSSPSSFLHPDDSPHKSPFHLIWFYRGSEIFQLFMFGFTGILAILYLFGLSPSSLSSSSSSSSGIVTLLFWLNLVAMQCRNMHVHDGSDTFSRHLLLWSIFLPMNQMWSLDAYLLNKKNGKKLQNVNDSTLFKNDIALWGIRLQIVFMYLGTVLARTTDIYGCNLYRLSKSEWLPPSLTAVYYSLNASFSTRDNWLGNLVRNNIQMTKVMTFSAMIIEGLVPIICLFMNMGYTEKKLAFLPPLLLFQLHFGLLLLMNLPNWQFIGMIATSIWIPSSVWNNGQRKLSIIFPNYFPPPSIPQSIETRHKKKDMEDQVLHEDTINIKPLQKGTFKNRFFKYFFFVYMIYNFANERKLIPKYDDGDIGEFLRFSQNWAMFTVPPKASRHDIFVGTIGITKDIIRTGNNETSTVMNVTQEVDVWEWMKNGEFVPIDLNIRKKQIWNNMTHIYPSPRLERMFSEWSSHTNTKALTYFLKKLCIVGPFLDLTFIWQHLHITSPTVEGPRFSKSRNDKVFHMNCNKSVREDSSIPELRK